MPNWCENHMKITGAAEEITRFKQTCIIDGELDFNAITPMPAIWIEPFIDDGKGGITEKEPGAYERSCAHWKEATGYDHPNDWASDHWGTKWDACGFYLDKDEPTCLECSFDTAWSPPNPVWEKLGEMFPMLTFELSGCEPNCDFAFRGTIQDGRMELRDALIEWSAVDPKTGETICGSPEELEEALGEDWSEDATYGVGPDMPEQADVRQAHAWLEQQELIESKLIDDEERWRLTDKGKLWYVEVGLLPYNEIRKKALLHQRGLAEILFFASQIPYLPAAEQETLSDEDKHPFARTGFLMDLRAGKRRLILNEGEYEFKNPAAERIDKIKEAAKAFAAKRSAA